MVKVMYQKETHSYYHCLCQQITPKGRGRPRKAKVDEEVEEDFDDDSEGVGKKKRGRKRTATAEGKNKKGGKVPTLKIKLGKRKKDTSVSLVRWSILVNNCSFEETLVPGSLDLIFQVLVVL